MVPGEFPADAEPVPARLVIMAGKQGEAEIGRNWIELNRHANIFMLYRFTYNHTRWRLEPTAGSLNRIALKPHDAGERRCRLCVGCV